MRSRNKGVTTRCKVGRPGISQLPLPSPSFDLTATLGFETAQSVTDEDRYRAATFRKRAESAGPLRARRLRTLADAIDPEVEQAPQTPASSRYMRDARNRVIGAIWDLIETGGTPACLAAPDEYAVFTAIPEDCSVPLGTLHHVDPTRLMAAFRQHIIRSAQRLGVPVEGQLFAALHGAYDPATSSYPLHVHGIATGGMVKIVDGLRDLRKYRPVQPNDGRDAAHTPVRLGRGPLTNMPEPLTYVMKRFWPLRETYLDSDGLRKAYNSKVARIRGEAEIEHLRFLDKWRIEDVTLMMGMHATKAGLKLK